MEGFVAANRGSGAVPADILSLVGQVCAGFAGKRWAYDRTVQGKPFHSDQWPYQFQIFFSLSDQTSSFGTLPQSAPLCVSATRGESERNRKRI